MRTLVVCGEDHKSMQNNHNDNDAKLASRASRFARRNTDYGFVSRGEDSRLQHSAKEREKYFNKIVQRFVTYCESIATSTLTQELGNYTAGTGNDKGEKTDVTMDSILASLRKLREAMINITPDKFTIRVFLFSIRIAANIGHYQTYVPAIKFLLSNCKGLTEVKEIQEISTLLILHLSHFNNLNLQALKLYFQYHKTVDDDTKLFGILQSWATKDFYTWVKYYNNENDIARSKIMRFGINAAIDNIVQNIEVSYFHLDKRFFQDLLPQGTKVEDLPQYGVKWRDDNGVLVIRDRRH